MIKVCGATKKTKRRKVMELKDKKKMEGGNKEYNNNAG